MQESETSGLPLQAMVLTNTVALATFIPYYFQIMVKKIVGKKNNKVTNKLLVC